jgi:hypothetical protein
MKMLKERWSQITRVHTKLYEMLTHSWSMGKGEGAGNPSFRKSSKFQPEATKFN